MGLVCQNIDIENWINDSSQNCRCLTDKEYHRLIDNWKKIFWQNIETNRNTSCGNKALLKFERILPIDVYLFSGVQVEVAANMGGYKPQGYYAERLMQINLNLCRTQELIIADKNFSITLVCSA